MFLGTCVFEFLYTSYTKTSKKHTFSLYSKNSTGVKYFYTGGMFHVEFSKAITENTARLWFLSNWGVAINQWKAFIHCAIFNLPRIDVVLYMDSNGRLFHSMTIFLVTDIVCLIIKEYYWRKNCIISRSLISLEQGHRLGHSQKKNIATSPNIIIWLFTIRSM